MTISWLEKGLDTLNNDTVYSLDRARERYEVRELGYGGYLVLNHEPATLWLNFAVLEFHSSEADGGNVQLSCVFHGEGPSSSLRECRHTYWGESGYLFYPDGRIIAAAFKELAEFYDEMAVVDSSPATVNVSPADWLEQRTRERAE